MKGNVLSPVLQVASMEFRRLIGRFAVAALILLGLLVALGVYEDHLVVLSCRCGG